MAVDAWLKISATSTRIMYHACYIWMHHCVSALQSYRSLQTKHAGALTRMPRTLKIQLRSALTILFLHMTSQTLFYYPHPDASNQIISQLMQCDTAADMLSAHLHLECPRDSYNIQCLQAPSNFCY